MCCVACMIVAYVFPVKLPIVLLLMSTNHKMQGNKKDVCFIEVGVFEYGLYMCCVEWVIFAYDVAVKCAIALLLISRKPEMHET